jgi:hypothetical protein
MRLRISDYRHWSHVCNLLTVERSLAGMIVAGADPKVVGKVADWWNFDTKTVNFPQNLPTYKYHPEQVFLKGMWEQYFPHIDMSSDFPEGGPTLEHQGLQEC